MAKKTYNASGESAESRALDRFAEMMIEKISEIQKDWQKPWFTPGAMKWPRNLSGREYNGQNALMLMLHCEKNGYKIPVFCTFNRVSGLNYVKGKDGSFSPAVDKDGERLPTVTVNKGEKSFPIFLTTYTVVHKDTKEKIKWEDFKKLGKEERENYNVYPKSQVFNVFNIDQTNLKDARPELYEKIRAENDAERAIEDLRENEIFQPLDAMIKHGLWLCPIKPTFDDQAYYSISKDEIVVPEPKQFKDGEAFAANCFHEMAHSTGSQSRLNRLVNGATFGSEDYSREELVAELTAALTASRYGIAKHIKDDSASYLKSWLDHLQQDPQFIKSVLGDVRKASSMLNQRIDIIQDQIDRYQEDTGRKDMPDFFDVDLDGITNEVIHSENRPFEMVESLEDAPFKRGR